MTQSLIIVIEREREKLTTTKKSHHFPIMQQSLINYNLIIKHLPRVINVYSGNLDNPYVIRWREFAS
jgi:hypothetical protein